MLSRSITTGPAIERWRLGERLLLHRQSGLQVYLGRFNRLAPELQGDHGSVDARLQQIEGHGESQDMYGDAFVFQ
jgi:hypothetical protein